MAGRPVLLVRDGRGVQENLRVYTRAARNGAGTSVRPARTQGAGLTGRM